MTERIMTQHPEGKAGVNIDKEKYSAVRDAILSILSRKKEIDFKSLPPAVAQKLPTFEGSIGWYTTTVKLDLEARGLIERMPEHSPQRLRLVNNGK